MQGLTKEQLSRRKEFVDAHIKKTAAWWQANMNMVLDGVTLALVCKLFCVCVCE